MAALLSQLYIHVKGFLPNAGSEESFEKRFHSKCSKLCLHDFTAECLMFNLIHEYDLGNLSRCVNST